MRGQRSSSAFAKSVRKCSSEGVRGVGPIRRGLADQAETTTSNVAGRCIGDGSNNNSGYCLHTQADGRPDVETVSSCNDMADIKGLKAVGDGEKGRIDARTVCTPATRTAKWEKVVRKGECKGIAK
jgi:hypothetical protein